MLRTYHFQKMPQSTLPLSQTWSVVAWLRARMRFPSDSTYWQKGQKSGFKLGWYYLTDGNAFHKYTSRAIVLTITLKTFPVPMPPGNCKVHNLLLFWVPHFDYVALSLLLVPEWPLAVGIIKVTAYYSRHWNTSLLKILAMDPQVRSNLFHFTKSPLTHYCSDVHGMSKLLCLRKSSSALTLFKQAEAGQGCGWLSCLNWIHSLLQNTLQMFTWKEGGMSESAL